MSRPTTIDVDKLAALLVTAIRSGVRDLPAELRRQGVAAGPELIVLKALIGSGQARAGQASPDGAAMAESGGVTQIAYRYVDAGRLLDVSESTVKRLVTSGQLRAIDVGGSRRIPESELEGFVAKQMAPKPEPSRTPDEEH